MPDAPSPDDMHENSEESSTISEGQNDTVLGLVDKVGNPFDPEYHMTDDAGKPILTKDGFCRRPLGGKKVKGKILSEKAQNKGNKIPPHLRDMQQVDSAVDVDNKIPLTDSPSGEPLKEKTGELIKKPLSPKEAKMAAKSTVNMLRKVNVGIGGATFDFQKSIEHSVDERAEHEEAFSTYYLASGKADMPPVVGLCFTLGMFYLSRFSQQEVMEQAKKDSKFFSWFSRTKEKVSLWRKKRALDKLDAAARKGAKTPQAQADIAPKKETEKETMDERGLGNSDDD